MQCAERGATVPSLGYHARSCNASTKQISTAKALYTYCTRQGVIEKKKQKKLLSPTNFCACFIFAFIIFSSFCSLLCVFVCTWLCALCDTLSSCMVCRTSLSSFAFAGCNNHVFVFQPICVSFLWPTEIQIELFFGGHIMFIAIVLLCRSGMTLTI